MMTIPEERPAVSEDNLIIPSEQQLRRVPWKLLLAMGIGLIIIGTLMIALPFVGTLAVNFLIGSLLLAGGILQTIELFRKHNSPGLVWRILSAFIYIAAGLALLFFPLTSILTLTLILSGFFLAEGVLKIIWAFQHRSEGGKKWGWILFSGLLALLLGVLIWAQWPSSAAWVIGLLAGIDLLFAGWTLVMLAFALKDSIPHQKV